MSRLIELGECSPWLIGNTFPGVPRSCSHSSHCGTSSVPVHNVVLLSAKPQDDGDNGPAKPVVLSFKRLPAGVTSIQILTAFHRTQRGKPRERGGRLFFPVDTVEMGCLCVGFSLGSSPSRSSAWDLGPWPVSFAAVSGVASNRQCHSCIAVVDLSWG